MSRARRPPPSPVRAALEIVVVSLVLGVVAGVLWLALAPDILVEVVDGGVSLDIHQGQKLFDREGVFACLVAVAGLLVAVPMAVRHDRLPVTTLLALVGGGALGAAAAMGVGRIFGPGAVEPLAAQEHVGAHLALPFTLDAWAAMITWPLAAAVVVAMVSIFRDDHSSWVMGRGGEQEREADEPVSQAARSSPS